MAGLGRGRGHRRRPSPPGGGRRRPTRSTSSIPPALPASPRAWCATTAATPWPCAGRWRAIYGVQPRRRVLGGLRHRLGRRALLHRVRAAAGRHHDRPVRGQARGHARRRHVLARWSRSPACKVLFTAPTAIRAIRRKTPTGTLPGATTSPPCATCSGRRAAATPPPTHWAGRASWACPSSTTGGRPRRAGPSGHAGGLESLPVKAGSAGAPGARLRRGACSIRRAGGECRGAPRAARRAPAAAARAPAHPLARRRAASGSSYLETFPGYYLTRRRRLPSTPTATSTSWAASTT